MSALSVQPVVLMMLGVFLRGPRAAPWFLQGPRMPLEARAGPPLFEPGEVFVVLHGTPSTRRGATVMRLWATCAWATSC